MTQVSSLVQSKLLANSFPPHHVYIRSTFESLITGVVQLGREFQFAFGLQEGTPCATHCFLQLTYLQSESNSPTLRPLPTTSLVLSTTPFQPSQTDVVGVAFVTTPLVRINIQVINFSFGLINSILTFLDLS